MMPSASRSPRLDAAHPVPHGDAVRAARARDGPVPVREHDRRAALEHDGLAP
jgi:hypothetical protein